MPGSKERLVSRPREVNIVPPNTGSGLWRAVADLTPGLGQGRHKMTWNVCPKLMGTRQEETKQRAEALSTQTGDSVGNGV